MSSEAGKKYFDLSRDACGPPTAWRMLTSGSAHGHQSARRHRSAAEAAVRAMKCWLRVKADMALGAYAMFEASSTIPEPIWPTATLKELLKIAFRDRPVDGLGHPVI